MKLSEIMSKPLNEALSEMDVAKLSPISDDSGNVVKVIVEYTPKQPDPNKNSTWQRG